MGTRVVERSREPPQMLSKNKILLIGFAR